MGQKAAVVTSEKVREKFTINPTRKQKQ